MALEGIREGLQNILRNDNQKILVEGHKLRDRLENSSVNDDLKNVVFAFCDKINDDEFASISSDDKKYLLQFITGLTGSLPSDGMIDSDKDRVVKAFEAKKEAIDSTISAMDTLFDVRSKSDDDKKLKDTLKAFRRIGLDIVNNDGVFEENNDPNTRVEPETIGGEDYLPIKKEAALNYLNRKGVQKLFPSKDFLNVYREDYSKKLKGKVSDPLIVSLVSKYNERNPEYRYLAVTEGYFLNSNLYEYFTNELNASSCDVAMKAIDAFPDKPKEKDFWEDIYDNSLNSSRKISAKNGNDILQEYISVLDDYDRILNGGGGNVSGSMKDDVAKYSAEIEKKGAYFAAVKTICREHLDFAKTLDKDNFLELMDCMEVVSFEENVTTVNITRQPSFMSPDELNKINATLGAKGFENFKSLLRSDTRKTPSVEQSAEQNDEQDEDIEEIDETPTNDVPLLKIIRARTLNALDKGESFSAIEKTFEDMQNDAVAFNISLIAKQNKDIALTYEEWTNALGCEFLDIIADPAQKNDIIECKKKGEAFQMPELSDIAAARVVNDEDILKSYLALIKLKENHPNNKIEFLSDQQINNELSAIRNSLSGAGLTDQEKDKASKLRDKYRYMQAKEKSEVAKDNSKKVFDDIMNDDSFKGKKEELDKEVEEEPATKKEAAESKPTETKWPTYAEKNSVPDKESLAKKLKGYNTKYLTKLIDDIMKIILKTKIKPKDKSKDGEAEITNIDTTDGPKVKDGNDKTADEDDEKKPDVLTDDAAGMYAGLDESRKAQDNANNNAQQDPFEAIIDVFKKFRDVITQGAVEYTPEQEELEGVKRLFEALATLSGGNHKLENDVLANVLSGNKNEISAILPNSIGSDANLYAGLCRAFGNMTPGYLQQILSDTFGKKTYDLTGDMNIVGAILGRIDVRVKEEEKNKQQSLTKIQEGYDLLIGDIIKSKEGCSPEVAFEKLEDYATHNDPAVQQMFLGRYGFDTTILLVAMAYAFPDKYGQLGIDMTNFTHIAAACLAQKLIKSMDDIKKFDNTGASAQEVKESEEEPKTNTPPNDIPASLLESEEEQEEAEL